jgi:hypothetical protein
MRIELIGALETLGILPKMIRAGFIAPNALYYRELFYKVDLELKINGAKKNRAVKAVADREDISEQTIWNALKYMTEPIP